MAEFPIGESLATAPPPPTEVKIRTMRSDLQSMAASGGGLPGFERMKVSGLASGKESSASIARAESKGNLALIVVLVIIAAVLAAIAWMVYRKFAGG